MWIIVVKNAQEQEHCRTYLKPGTVATIGRAPDCTIFVSVMTVSRIQGRIEIRKGHPVYFDDESSTGARVDGQYVRGPTPLSEKNVLEIGGYRFTIERDPAAKSEVKAVLPPPKPAASELNPEWIDTAAAGKDAADLEGMLARRIRGIRQHRDQNQQESKARQSQVEIEWTQLIESVRRFQQKLAGDARLQAFSISRDQQEVLLKINDKWSPRGYCSLILARHHPDGKHTQMDGAWLLEMGQQDAYYPSPKSAMEEFVHRLAPRLA